MRSRRYHHEDPRFPTLLTGISAQRLSRHGQARNERLNTWAYDEERRAVLSFKGERPSSTTGTTGTAVATGQDQVSLQHGPTEHGQRTTVLANSLGQRTVYTSTTIAGEPRLLQAIGPGCASCTPGNRRYGYDRVGRLIEETVLDDQGHPLRSTRTERDAYGRPVKVSTVKHHHRPRQRPHRTIHRSRRCHRHPHLRPGRRSDFADAAARRSGVVAAALALRRQRPAHRELSAHR